MIDGVRKFFEQDFEVRRQFTRVISQGSLYTTQISIYTQHQHLIGVIPFPALWLLILKNCLLYAVCPEPELTLSTSGHADSGFLKLLIQDQLVGGLQVRHENHWVDVPPLDGAIVVNVGDLLQVLLLLDSLVYHLHLW